MISIIIPAWNQHEMTRECINLLDSVHSEPYELILVDNGSDPSFKEATIRNETNLGFPVAVNQGIREARGDIIVLLNNDVIVTPGWDTKILKHLETYSIIGPTTNFCAGIQRVGIPVYSGIDELFKHAEEWTSGKKGKIKETNWVIGFLFAFRRSLYDEIGQFDESLWPCSGEEIDFCLRAKKAGHRVGIAQDIFVHHDGSVTFDALEKEGIVYEKVIEKSNEHLQNKWGKNVFINQEVKYGDNGEGVRLNLGCGFAKLPGFINIDRFEEVAPDVSWDLLAGIPFDTDSVDMVRAYDFLEHVPAGSTAKMIEEIWRVLKPGGLFESMTPDAEHGQGAYQDPFHLSFWCENSWLYYSHPEYRSIYGINANFDIESIERIETDPQFRVTHLHVRAIARK